MSTPTIPTPPGRPVMYGSTWRALSVRPFVGGSTALYRLEDCQTVRLLVTDAFVELAHLFTAPATLAVSVRLECAGRVPAGNVEVHAGPGPVEVVAAAIPHFYRGIRELDERAALRAIYRRIAPTATVRNARAGR